MRIPYKGAGTVLLRFIDNQWEVFLGRRSDHPFYYFMAIPGGGFEKRKDISEFDNAIRECKEETSIDLITLIKSQKVQLLGDKKISFPFFSWRSFFFLCKDVDFSNLRLNELSYVGWYKIKDLNPLMLRPFTRLEIKRCQNLCQTLQRPPLA